MDGRIVEVTRVGTEKKANELLQAGWELYGVAAKSPQDKSIGVHWILVKKQAQPS